jgi:hypothetical protein
VGKDRQSSWASGELSPDLYGQAGSPVYRSGAALLRNFQVTPQALPVNRTGSVYLKTLGSKTARIVPFIFGDDPARIIQLYWRGGQFVVRDADGNLISAAENPAEGYGIIEGIDLVDKGRDHSLDELRRVRIAQCAGTMMVAGGYRPIDSAHGLLYDILRASSSSYVSRNVSTTPPPFGSAAVPYDPITKSKVEPAIVTTQTGYALKGVGGDATHPPREWDYAVTRVVSIEDGNPDKPNQVIETSARGFSLNVASNGLVMIPFFNRLGYSKNVDTNTYFFDVPLEIAVYGDWNQRIDCAGQAGDPWTDVPGGQKTGIIVAHRVYRGRNGVFGYIGQTTTRYFVDDGREPDIANPPPQGSLPFLWDDPTKTQLGPLAVAFQNDRRFYAAPGGNSGRIGGSAVGNWADFDPVITPDASDAIAFDLAANEHQGVRHLHAGQTLVAMTGLAGFAITGSGDLNVLTPTNVDPRKVLTIGSAHYPAPVEGDSGIEGQSSSLFICEAKGGRPYVVTSNGNGAMQLIDLSLFSSHFFKNRRIVSWAWARDPNQTLWVALDDGSLLSLCFSPGSDVRAWAKHTLAGGGLVESLAVLPIGGEDLLYMVVKRGEALNLERMAPQIVSDSRYECYLDCAFISDVSKHFGMTVDNITGGGAAPYHLDITIETTGGLAPGNDIIFPDVNGEYVRMTIDAVAGTDVDATVTGYAGGGALAVSAGHKVASTFWGNYDDTIPAPGLPDGTVVTAVCDGAVYPNLVVGADVSANVTPPIPCLIRITGLPYTSDMAALPVEQERGKQKQVSHSLVEAVGRGGSTGRNFDNLQEIPPRQVSDGYDTIKSKFEGVKIPVAGNADVQAVVVVRQSQPKPLKILAVEREYVLGG